MCDSEYDDGIIFTTDRCDAPDLTTKQLDTVANIVKIIKQYLKNSTRNQDTGDG